MPSPTYTRADLIDLDLLCALADRESCRSEQGGGSGPTHVDAARVEGLVARSWLLPDPGSPIGLRVSVLGLSHLHRFLRSPIGSAGPRMPIHEECSLRRAILDTLDPDDRPEIERRLVNELLALRHTLFCSFQARCRHAGCPLADSSAIELCDLALFRLSRERPWPIEERGRA